MPRDDPSTRCEMRTNYGVKGRCRCRIGRKHGLLTDTLRLVRLVSCDNHWRALRRGSTVRDIHGRQCPRGPYVIEDKSRVIYDGDDLHRALFLMKRATDKAKLYRIEKGEEGEDVHILLAFRKGVPASTTPEPAAVSF